MPLQTHIFSSFAKTGHVSPLQLVLDTLSRDLQGETMSPRDILSPFSSCWRQEQQMMITKETFIDIIDALVMVVSWLAGWVRWDLTYWPFYCPRVFFFFQSLVYCFTVSHWETGFFTLVRGRYMKSSNQRGILTAGEKHWCWSRGFWSAQGRTPCRLS